MQSPPRACDDQLDPKAWSAEWHQTLFQLPVENMDLPSQPVSPGQHHRKQTVERDASEVRGDSSEHFPEKTSEHFPDFEVEDSEEKQDNRDTRQIEQCDVRPEGTPAPPEADSNSESPEQIALPVNMQHVCGPEGSPRPSATTHIDVEILEKDVANAEKDAEVISDDDAVGDTKKGNDIEVEKEEAKEEDIVQEYSPAEICSSDIGAFDDSAYDAYVIYMGLMNQEYERK